MRNTTRPLVPRSLLTALVSSGAATDTKDEVCDGDTETARAFDDALTALKREFDN